MSSLPLGIIPMPDPHDIDPYVTKIGIQSVSPLCGWVFHLTASLCSVDKIGLNMASVDVVFYSISYVITLCLDRNCLTTRGQHTQSTLQNSKHVQNSKALCLGKEIFYFLELVSSRNTTQVLKKLEMNSRQNRKLCQSLHWMI